MTEESLIIVVKEKGINLFRNICQNCNSIRYSFSKIEDFFCNNICRLELKRKQEMKEEKRDV
jgi:hypothetical protein